MGRKSLAVAAAAGLVVAGSIFIAHLAGRRPDDRRPSRDSPLPAETGRRVSATPSKAPSPERERWTVFGRVLWKARRPAGGVLVRLDPPPREMRTGSDGRFIFADVNPGEKIHLTIDEPSSALRILRLEPPDPEDHFRKDLGDILLEPALSLVVRLVGPRDEPLEKGKAFLVPALDNEEMREGQGRGLGEFIFGRLPPGSYEVHASAPGHIGNGGDAELPREEPLVIKLEEGHRIAGTVRASDGTPIEGAVVMCDEENKAKTDAAGRFLIDTLLEGSHEIQASAEGFVTDSKEISTGIEDAEFWLIREAVISGRVVCEEDDRPIKDARIVVDLSEDEFNAVSGEDGRFELKKLPPGNYEIRASHEERLPAKGGPFEVAQGNRIEDLVIQMKKGFSIGGKALESASGSPLGGAQITFSLKSKDDGLDLGRDASAGEDGEFLVKGLKEGVYVIGAEKTGYRMDPLEIAVSPNLEEPIILHLEKVEKDPTLGKISGRVLDPDGNAVANTTVYLLIPKERSEQYSRTDVEGRFLFEYVPPGNDYEILVNDRLNYRVPLLTGIQVALGQAVEGLEVRLLRGGTIRGRILDEKGGGIGEARISLEAFSSPRSPFGYQVFSGWCDAGGNFVIKGISPGLYKLEAEAEGCLSPPSRSIAIAEGETIDGQDFILAAGLVLSGRVADMVGNPLSGAVIEVLGEEVTSGNDGAFQIKGLPSGWVDLGAKREGFETKEMKVLLPAKEVLMELDRKASISGRVQAEGRDVFPPGDLVAREIRKGDYESFKIDTTGRFQLQVPKGGYRLEASVPGFARSGVEVVLAPGEKREGLVIELRSGGVIRGRAVRQGSGEPVEGVTVSVKEVKVKTGPDGSFMIEKVPEGEVDLEARHPDFAAVKPQRIPIREGEIREVAIELSTGGSIRGSVSLGGKPVTSPWTAYASLEGSDGSRFSRIKSDGRFEIKGLAAGDWVVSIENTRQEQTIFKEKVVVRESQITEMDIEVETVRLSCRVTSGGKSARFAEVSAAELEKGWESEPTVTDAGGNFAMDLPGSGTYVLKIFPSEGGKARIEMIVPEGVKEFRKDLDLDSREISGTVLDAATGAPVEEADVWAFDSGFSSRRMASLIQALRGSDTTDGAGRFSISHLAPGSYGLLVRTWDDHVPVRLDRVAAGDGKELSIALERGISIRLNVLDEGGRPVAGAWAILRDRSGDIIQLFDGDESDAQGILALQGIRPGSYRVSVGDGSHAPARFTFSAPARDGEQQILLKSGGTVRVTVTGPGGDPARGASVLLLDERGDDIAEELGLFARDRYEDGWKLLSNDLFTGKDGSLTLRHVPPGAYRVLARRGAARSSEEKLLVTEGQVSEASLILSE